MQYIRGSLKPGTDIQPGLEENLRFISYRYDPVKRGLNPYRYCDNDPADYVDPTGEILNIVGGATLGGIFGGAAGFISSAVSQAMSGEKFDAKKAWGAAANGAITGAAQGALIGSGAGIPVALAANFAAGTAGSAAEQYISTGKVDARKSITGGLTNAVSNLIYGTDPLGSAGEAFARGFGAGAATSGINYISDFLGNRQSVMSGAGAGAMSGISAGAVPPYEMQRDPRRGCGSASPFTPGIGYSSAKGYQYSVPRTEVVGQSRQKGFSLKDFALQTIAGGITGGVASAAFYGAGKGIERLKESARSNRSNVYYHVTTEENAQKIISSGELGRRNNNWECRVFAWNKQPTRRQASIAGIGREAETVLRFRTNASFQPDKGNAAKSIEKIVVETTDGQRVPISIWDIESVGFRKEWWQFWKK